MSLQFLARPEHLLSFCTQQQLDPLPPRSKSHACQYYVRLNQFLPSCAPIPSPHQAPATKTIHIFHPMIPASPTSSPLLNRPLCDEGTIALEAFVHPFHFQRRRLLRLLHRFCTLLDRECFRFCLRGHLSFHPGQSGVEDARLVHARVAAGQGAADQCVIWVLVEDAGGRARFVQWLPGASVFFPLSLWPMERFDEWGRRDGSTYTQYLPLDIVRLSPKETRTWQAVVLFAPVRYVRPAGDGRGVDDGHGVGGYEFVTAVVGAA